MNRTDFDIELKWEFIPEGLGYMCSAMVAADADKDGECEVFVGSYTYRLYCLRGNDGTVKWSYRLPRDFVGCNCVLLDDVDGDGKLEVIFGTEPNPTVYVLKTEEGLNDRLLWKRRLGGQFIAGGLISFTDLDNRKKIIALTRRMEFPEKINDGQVQLLDAETGELLWGPIGEQDVCSSGPAVADLNGDGVLEFVYGNHRWRDIPLRGCAVCRSVKDGSIVWKYLTKDDPGANTMTICDINDDDEQEVIVTYMHYQDVIEPHYGTVVLSGRDGRKLWEKNLWAGRGIAVGDVLGEKVVCGGGSLENHQAITCVNGRDGKIRWKNNIKSGRKGVPLAVDINGDKIDEFILGDSNNNILILSGKDGTLLFKEAYISDRKVTEKSTKGIHLLSIADVDDDDYWDIMFTSMDGRARCLDTNIPIPSGVKKDFLMEAGSPKRLSNVKPLY